MHSHPLVLVRDLSANGSLNDNDLSNKMRLIVRWLFCVRDCSVHSLLNVYYEVILCS